MPAKPCWQKGVIMDTNTFLCRFRRKGENRVPSKMEYWFRVQGFEGVEFILQNVHVGKFKKRELEYYHESLMEISDKKALSFGKKVENGTGDEGYYIYEFSDSVRKEILTNAQKLGIDAEEGKDSLFGVEDDLWDYVKIYPEEVYARIKED
jgi:hypothetical protein